MKYTLLPLLLLVTGCATHWVDTARSLKAECDLPGAQVVISVSNVDGIETMKSRCSLTIPQEDLL